MFLTTVCKYLRPIPVAYMSKEGKKNEYSITMFCRSLYFIRYVASFAGFIDWLASLWSRPSLQARVLLIAFLDCPICKQSIIFSWKPAIDVVLYESWFWNWAPLWTLLNSLHGKISRLCLSNGTLSLSVYSHPLSHLLVVSSPAVSKELSRSRLDVLKHWKVVYPQIRERVFT